MNTCEAIKDMYNKGHSRKKSTKKEQQSLIVDLWRLEEMNQKCYITKIETMSTKSG